MWKWCLFLNIFKTLIGHFCISCQSSALITLSYDWHILHQFSSPNQSENIYHIEWVSGGPSTIGILPPAAPTSHTEKFCYLHVSYFFSISYSHTLSRDLYQGYFTPNSMNMYSFYFLTLKIKSVRIFFSDFKLKGSLL